MASNWRQSMGASHSGAEVGLFRVQLVNTIAADALAPFASRLSAGMVLTT